MKTHTDGHVQHGLWEDSCHPPRRMCEQIADLGAEWLPRARQALDGRDLPDPELCDECGSPTCYKMECMLAAHYPPAGAGGGR